MLESQPPFDPSVLLKPDAVVVTFGILVVVMEHLSILNS